MTHSNHQESVSFDDYYISKVKEGKFEEWFIMPPEDYFDSEDSQICFHSDEYQDWSNDSYYDLNNM